MQYLTFNNILFYGGSSGALIIFVIILIQLFRYIRKLNQEIKENKNKNRNRFIIAFISLVIISLIGGSFYLVYSFIINNQPTPPTYLYLR